jgi:excinuclease UvrABC nuclease subunit
VTGSNDQDHSEPGSCRQLRLFAPSKPLLERFGPEFFRGVPQAPGVYLMYDSERRLIYVGQSKNLRQRLNSYRHANPETHSRKVIRLIHSVSHIELELCEDARSARLRENFLLRTRRPKFNSANTYPKAYVFLVFIPSGSSLRLRWTTEVPGEGEIYGAFKRRAIYAYGALLRLLWMVLRQPALLTDFPAGCFSGKLPGQFELTGALCKADLQTFTGPLSQYLAGESEELVDLLQAGLGNLEEQCLFLRNTVAADLENLAEFFRTGPFRNYQLRQRHGIRTTWIPQEELDDLILSQAPPGTAEVEEAKAQSPKL